MDTLKFGNARVRNGPAINLVEPINADVAARRDFRNGLAPVRQQFSRVLVQTHARIIAING